MISLPATRAGQTGTPDAAPGFRAGTEMPATPADAA